MGRKKRKLKKKVYKTLIFFILAFILITVINNINEIKAMQNSGFGKYDKVIVIDMGHGGKDQGTSNKSNGILEKDIVLEIGEKVAAILKKDRKLTIIETRTTDEFLTLNERVEISNNNNADVFISLHCNAVENDASSYYGVESFYWRDDTEESYNLASAIQNSIITNLDVNDRGVKKDNYYVVKNTKCAAALIEMGFLTNNKECKNLSNDKYQTKMAKAIVDGIYDYLSIQ